MTARKRTPGIIRTDREKNRTCGYSVRLKRKGKVHAKLFSDGVHGGQKGALEAAQKHYQELWRKHGVMTRRLRALIRRRKSVSGIVGVQKVIVKKPGRQLLYWRAVWSPRPNVVRKKMVLGANVGRTTGQSAGDPGAEPRGAKHGGLAGQVVANVPVLRPQDNTIHFGATGRTRRLLWTGAGL